MRIEKCKQKNISRTTKTSAIVLYLVSSLLFFIPHAQAQTEQQTLELRAHAEAFRLTASTDFLEALQLYGTPEANLKFASMGKILWPDINIAKGWSLLLQTSLVNMADIDSSSRTVAFFHPWSDILLITKWEKTGQDDLKIIQANVLIGSLFRKLDTPTPTVRKFQTTNLYAPEAIGILSADFTHGLEDLFSVIDEDLFQQLRQEGKTTIQHAAAKMFAEFLTDLKPVSTNGNADYAIKLWNDVLYATKNKSPDLNKKFRVELELLSKINSKIGNSFVPVSFQSTTKNSVLILASQLNPDLYIAMQMALSGGQSELSRLNLYSFQSFYENYSSLQELIQ